MIRFTIGLFLSLVILSLIFGRKRSRITIFNSDGSKEKRVIVEQHSPLKTAAKITALVFFILVFIVILLLCLASHILST